jgi:catechol 2,3-dioxygenase-like lactoylglutathione lyase family enzyme
VAPLFPLPSNESTEAQERELAVHFQGIARVILPVSDLDAACAPFERLGLIVSPARRPANQGFTLRQLAVGGPGILFDVEIFCPDPGGDPTSAQGQHGLQDRGLSAIVLRVADMGAALAALAERGIQATSRTIYDVAGRKRIELANLPDLPDAAAPLRLMQPYMTDDERLAEYFGGRTHALSLKRLDHLAAVAPDLERSCRFWEEMLGVPTVGEVISPTTVVRQLRIGDAIFELLGPASADSPIRQRPPGLSSSCSFEVPTLEAAVAHARAAGFTVPDPRVGTLPGTIVSTIPAAEMSGLNLQLLQYVG